MRSPDARVPWGSFVFLAGGNYNNGDNDGPFYFNCNNGWTNSNWNYGFRSILNNSTNK